MHRLIEISIASALFEGLPDLLGGDPPNLVLDIGLLCESK